MACPPARLTTPLHDVATKSIPFLATSPGKDRVVLVYSDKIQVRTKVNLQILLISFLDIIKHVSRDRSPQKSCWRCMKY
jgi:hypothetical protein